MKTGQQFPINFIIQAARQIEENLYQTAPSFQDYFDKNTLGNRVQQAKEDMDRAQRIRTQKLRLIRLHHASKCSSSDCCSEAKQLWNHMATCKQNTCGFTECNQSRRALSHYYKCKDDSCPVCVPVRKVERSHKRHEEERKLMLEENLQCTVCLTKKPTKRVTFQSE